jgi:hypothetical protein
MPTCNSVYQQVDSTTVMSLLSNSKSSILREQNSTPSEHVLNTCYRIFEVVSSTKRATMEAFIDDDAMCMNCGDIIVNKVYLVRMIQRCTWDRQSESIN